MTMRETVLIVCAMLLPAPAIFAQSQATKPPKKKTTATSTASHATTSTPHGMATSGHTSAGDSSHGGAGGRGITRVPAAAFLTRDAKEPEYGLYSYVLFGSQPEFIGSDQWLRYRETIRAFLLMPDVRWIRQIPLDHLNATFLPLTCPASELPDAFTPASCFRFSPALLDAHRRRHEQAGTEPLPPDTDGGYSRWSAEAACILVSSYDYGRATELLARFPGTHNGGPYIFSTTIPLSRSNASPSQFLIQDLSPVRPELIRLWVEEFKKQAHEEEFWKTNTKDQFILSLRNAIGELSQEFFASAIHWQFDSSTHMQ
jgi:hypothetical protein